MKTYLKPSDPGAFIGLEKRDPEPAASMLAAYATPRSNEPAPVVECAQCLGYGYWNLELDAYGPGKHFRALCDNCSGWGYVAEAQGSHVHGWDRGETIGNCLTRYRCAGCGKVSDVDSSD